MKCRVSSFNEIKSNEMCIHSQFFNWGCEIQSLLFHEISLDFNEEKGRLNEMNALRGLTSFFGWSEVRIGGLQYRTQGWSLGIHKILIELYTKWIVVNQEVFRPPHLFPLPHRVVLNSDKGVFGCKSDTTSFTEDKTHSQKDSFKTPRVATVIIGKYPNFPDWPPLTHCVYGIPRNVTMGWVTLYMPLCCQKHLTTEVIRFVESAGRVNFFRRLDIEEDGTTV
jgi:hypothetical protein